MIKSFIDTIQNIDESILEVMFFGFKLSLVICLFSIFALVLYSTYPFSNIVHKCTFILFRTGLMFVAYFFICAIATDIIRKQLL